MFDHLLTLHMLGRTLGQVAPVYIEFLSSRKDGSQNYVVKNPLYKPPQIQNKLCKLVASSLYFFKEILVLLLCMMDWKQAPHQLLMCTEHVTCSL